MKKKYKNEAWSSYWSEGNFNSLPNLFPENYTGAVSTYWNDCFKQLAYGSKVLDICTGNGAIALLAKEYADKSNIRYEIHAIDSAIVTPKIWKRKITDIDELKFNSNVFVEKTPFKRS